MDNGNNNLLLDFEDHNPLTETAEIENLLDIMCRLQEGQFLAAALAVPDVADVEYWDFLYVNRLESFYMPPHRIFWDIIQNRDNLLNLSEVREEVIRQIIGILTDYKEKRIFLLVSPEYDVVHITMIEVEELPLHLRPRTTEAQTRRIRG